MSAAKLVIAFLTVLLLASNVLWFCIANESINDSIELAYTSDREWNCQKSLTQALAILPVAASPTATPGQVVEVATQALDQKFEVRSVRGQMLVGGLSITFDAAGRVSHVSQRSAPTFDRRY